MSFMNKIYAVLPTYTADVSGVCSALYELGGMTVIHDPSGCNSTYNTHDEPRWYDQDSLVFISGLSQMDAIMGNDDKLIRDIVRAANDLKPAFISLVRTPVPLMTGMDFEGVAAAIEEETGIPTLYFPTTGMDTYVKGAGMALEEVARRIPEFPQAKDKTDSPSINISGATPLDFSVGSTMDSLKEWLIEKGYCIQSCLALGTSYEEVRSAGQGDLTLVISSVGLPAARVLKERFGIPYVIGFPVNEYGDLLDLEMKKALGDPAGEQITDQSLQDHEKTSKTVIIGEAVTSLSLAWAMGLEKGDYPEVICPLETDQEILQVCGPVRLHLIRGEEEIRAALRPFDRVIADPMYRPVCPQGVKLVSLPHEAFSGRIYRKDIPDLVKLPSLE